MSTFFSADFHYNHGNIIKYCNRPFLAEEDLAALNRDGKWHDGDWKGPTSSQHRISRAGVEMMNDAIVNNINKVVHKNDTLWFLGDWCFGGKNNYYQIAREFRDRLRCQNINMIWGNHDHRNIRDLFNECYDLFETYVNGQRMVLCHYAMAVWDKSHRGSWQLYGHSHSTMEEWMAKAMPGRRSMDVGIDNAAKLIGDYHPFSFEEIAHIMNSKPGFFADHHGNEGGIRTGPTEEELSDK
jgi:calcineurin-like phosphoesterase family protein